MHQFFFYDKIFIVGEFMKNKNLSELIFLLIVLVLVLLTVISYYYFGYLFYIFLLIDFGIIYVMFRMLFPSLFDEDNAFNILNKEEDYDKQKSKLAYHFIKHNTKGAKLERKMVEQYKYKSLTKDEILMYIPDYLEKEFKLKLFEIFKEVIYSLNDKEKLRNYVTDEFYNYLESSNINHFDKVNYSNIMLNNVIKENELLYLHTNVIFIVNNSKLYNYDVIFVRNINIKERTCSNCGSKLNDKATNKCPYCKAVIVSYYNNYVVANMKEES